MNDITSDAHLAVMAACKPGMFEFQLESTFLHHCYYNGAYVVRTVRFSDRGVEGVSRHTLHVAGVPMAGVFGDG